ncbi:universal stress protein [Micromonospora olivasterospora]|uniref:Nucleotide-binding universal stress UspA family protein n=1 Tax=Micromonospora olivasterospora TaxID=1880 RepID=A0A562IE67_MICOL|nr:universal stress protein [Micromonospora olivasterospora]TWH69146.1 nucleotide-binding universal stress UspA family protein [Micromonospora olivasterospora]
MTAPADAPVVAAVGPSEQTLQVVRLAAREAADHDRPLRLLHAFNWAAAPQAPPGTAPHEEAEHLLERAAAVAGEVEPAIPVGNEIVEGAAVAALLRRSETAFLVAIGDGGMHCVDCVPADAPAVQLAAQAGCPVLVVRPEPPPRGPILVGVDGSPSSHAALEFAFDCAARRSAPLLAVRVTEPVDGAASADADAAARAELAEAVARCGRRHPAVRARCDTVAGDPGPALVDRSRSAQLAVVAALGEDPWRGMLGSVSQSLLYRSPAPVIVVRGLVTAAGDGS